MVKVSKEQGVQEPVTPAWPKSGSFNGLGRVSSPRPSSRNKFKRSKDKKPSHYDESNQEKDKDEVHCTGGDKREISSVEHSQSSNGQASAADSACNASEKLRGRKRHHDATDPNNEAGLGLKIRNHRPKVVANGKPEKTPTPKPETPKPATPKQVNKRVPGNKKTESKLSIQKAVTALEKLSGTKLEPVLDPCKETNARKCKRILSFDVEAINTIVQSNKGNELNVQITNMDHASNQIGCKHNSLQVYHRTFRTNRCLRTSKQIGPNFPKLYASNQIGCKHDSLQVYHRTFRKNPCLRTSKQIGPNFPKLYKKLRTRKHKTTMCSPLHSATGTGPLDTLGKEVIDSILQKPNCQRNNSQGHQLTVRNQNADKPHGEGDLLVPYKGLPDHTKAKPLVPKVDLDEGSLRVWKMLMEKGDGECSEETDEDKRWWEDERELFRGRVTAFIFRMHLIQGNRRFSPWKGSVVDSVAGVFLTQNVGDNLSSSAFMSLAAQYPHKRDGGISPPEDFVGSSTVQGMDEVQISSASTSVKNWPTKKPCSEILHAQRDTSTSCSFSFNNPNIQIQPHLDATSTHKNNQTKNRTRLKKNRGQSEEMDSNKPETRTNMRSKKGKAKEKGAVDWDALRKLYSKGYGEESRNSTADCLDWFAVNSAEVDEVSKTIKGRGMQHKIAARIKIFLNRLVKEHGKINLEWLRNVPPEKAKEYLSSIEGLGLKSVECVRLLTLQHHAFAVDTNIGRVAIRLGWVPIQPLPEGLEIHLLEKYPMVNSIQKYLWPRLSTLDQRTLYELHYQMITFGKVFCTKRKPNCNACPMRGECKHFASTVASPRLLLPGPQEKGILCSNVPIESFESSSVVMERTLQSLLAIVFSESGPPTTNYQLRIDGSASQMPECTELLERDIEDLCINGEIPIVRPSTKEFMENSWTYMDENRIPFQESDMSKALVPLTSEAASIPGRKLKNVTRLRTEHQVYVLPDSHPLLAGLEKRQPGDLCKYLLALWTPDSSEQPKDKCDSHMSEELNCEECFLHNNMPEEYTQTVRGTLLIPCRTAMRGRFPLNGTYFQVNEVFADDESSQHPIIVPRDWLWNLERKALYCGTSVATIFRGLSTEEIQDCFWRGFVCVRGFNRKTRAPKPLSKRLHLSVSKTTSTRKQQQNGGT